MTKRRVRLPPGAGAGTGFRDHGVLDAPWPRWKTVRADESSPIPSAPDQPREQPKAGTGEVPGLLKRLAAVPDPRGVRHALVVVLDQQAGGARGGRSGSRARRSAPTKVCTAPTAPSGGSVHRSSTRRAGGRSGDRPRSAGPARSGAVAFTEAGSVHVEVEDLRTAAAAWDAFHGAEPTGSGNP